MFHSGEGTIISKDSKELRINEEIRCKEVRLIDDAGQQLGVMAPKEAAKIAAEKGLDLVEIAPTANPPVCRIMDYGKYRYEQSKREKEAKKNQKVISVKEASLKIVPIVESVELVGTIIPSYVTFDKETLKGTYVRLPERKELPADIHEELVVEFYNKKGV